MENINLAKNIVEFRKSNGWTQTELVEKSGVTYASVVKLEQGLMQNPTLKTLLKLSKAFKVSLDELIK